MSDIVRPSSAPVPPRECAPDPGTSALAVEGIFQSLGQGLGEAYLVAYALWLGAGGIALGLVATLPTAAGSAAQAVGYAALGLCPLLPRDGSIAALCVLALFAWGCGGLATPAWTALVSGVVPRARHGRFFGLRGALQQAGVLAAILGGAAILSWRTGRGEEGGGFAILFAAAAAARLAGTAVMARVPAHEAPAPRASRARGFAILRSSAKFRRLALYLWSLHLAANVSTPFFVPYMLRDLHFSYTLVGGLMAAPALVKMATMRLWGHAADRIGPGPLLRGTGWLVVVVPALWLVSGSPLWLLLAQIYSGVVWGAFELAQASSIMQATGGRERDVALYSAVDGGAIITGSLLGGAAVNLLATARGPAFLASMALSTVLRAAPAIALLWRVRGIGRPAYSHLGIPLRVFSIRPTRGLSIQPWPGLPAAAPEAAAPIGTPTHRVEGQALRSTSCG